MGWWKQARPSLLPILCRCYSSTIQSWHWCNHEHVGAGRNTWVRVESSEVQLAERFLWSYDERRLARLDWVHQEGTRWMERQWCDYGSTQKRNGIGCVCDPTRGTVFEEEIWSIQVSTVCHGKSSQSRERLWWYFFCDCFCGWSPLVCQSSLCVWKAHQGMGCNNRLPTNETKSSGLCLLTFTLQMVLDGIWGTCCLPKRASKYGKEEWRKCQRIQSEGKARIPSATQDSTENQLSCIWNRWCRTSFLDVHAIHTSKEIGNDAMPNRSDNLLQVQIWGFAQEWIFFCWWYRSGRKEDNRLYLRAYLCWWCAILRDRWSCQGIRDWSPKALQMQARRGIQGVHINSDETRSEERNDRTYSTWLLGEVRRKIQAVPWTRT